jgi:hypothetical protein
MSGRHVGLAGAAGRWTPVGFTKRASQLVEPLEPGQAGARFLNAAIGSAGREPVG